MIKYDIRTGITKIKTKTAVAISAVVLAASGLGLAVAIPAISHASSIPSNFPGDNGTSCDAWHGAPGGLGKYSPYYWVQNDPGFGQEQGVITGQTNSGFSASCNQ